MVDAQQVRGFLVLKKSLCGRHAPQEEEDVVFYEGVSLDVALQPLLLDKVIQKKKVWLCGSCESCFPEKIVAENCCQ